MTIERSDLGAMSGVDATLASERFYWLIFGTLVLLTLITVGVSYVDFGGATSLSRS